MKKCLFILSLTLLCLFCLSCKNVIDSPDSISNKNNMAYFYLSDSLQNIKTKFDLNQDVFFHFGIVNNQNSALHFTKSHGGPPINFVVFKNDSIWGNSDEGYAYPAIVVPGHIESHDTLKYSASWYSNPFHENILTSGDYYTIVEPYISFEYFNLSSNLDTVYFEITE